MGSAAQPTTTALRSEVLLQLLEVTRRLAAPFDLEAVLEEIGEAARKVLSAERATIWLYDADRQELVLTDQGPEPVRASVERGILGLTARTQTIVNVPDCRKDLRFDSDVDLDYDHDVRCLLSVPLVDQWQLVGVLQVVDRSEGPFTAEDERIAEALAAQCVVFIQRERISHSVKAAERIDREIRLAREIQMSTLPSAMPRLRGYEMAGRFVPADQTGGDTFDLVQLDDRRLFILLGDASGHGIGPALSATQLSGMLRVALRLGAGLDDIFAQVNNQLVEDLPDEHFVTAFVGMLDAEQNSVEYHAAGQGPLLHFHAASGECEWLAPTTYPLGFMSFEELGPSQQIQLAPGDILGLISDGVYESENAAGHMFGRAGVEEMLRATSHRSMPILLETLLDAVRRYAGGTPQADDITIVLIARQPEPTVASYVERSFGRSNAELDAIFAFVDAFFAGRSLDADLRQPVSFIVEELFTNMVKYNTDTQSEITLSLDHAPAQLTVRLVDTNVEPFDVASAPLVDVDKPLDARTIGGLGLHLVRSMADTLLYEYADRRSIVTFTKSLV